MKKRSTTDYRLSHKTTEVFKKSASKFSLAMIMQYASSTKTIKLDSTNIQLFLN